MLPELLHEPLNWWDVHQCVWMLIAPLGLGVTRHCQEQVLASFTAHSSSGCSSVNICCFTANRVCFYNQRWSALHHAREINVSWGETNLEHRIIYLPRFMLSPSPGLTPIESLEDFKFKILRQLESREKASFFFF